MPLRIGERVVFAADRADPTSDLLVLAGFDVAYLLRDTTTCPEPIAIDRHRTVIPATLPPKGRWRAQVPDGPGGPRHAYFTTDDGLEGCAVAARWADLPALLADIVDP